MIMNTTTPTAANGLQIGKPKLLTNLFHGTESFLRSHSSFQ